MKENRPPVLAHSRSIKPAKMALIWILIGLILGGLSFFGFFLGFGALSILPLFIGLFLGGRGLRNLLRTVPGTEALSIPQQNLRQDLGRLRLRENIENDAERLFNIYLRLEKREAEFRTALSSRLSPTELTYGRYLQAAEECHRVILSQIREAAERLKILGSFDLPKLKDNDTEETSIQDRRKLAEELQGKITQIFSDLERGVTEFDRILIALMEMKTDSLESEARREETYRQLRELAERAKAYSKV